MNENEKNNDKTKSTTLGPDVTRQHIMMNVNVALWGVCVCVSTRRSSRSNKPEKEKKKKKKKLNKKAKNWEREKKIGKKK